LEDIVRGFEQHTHTHTHTPTHTQERLRLAALAKGRPMQILFVDLSNTCRSPAAEATMRKVIFPFSF
jgi:hypothetical protein